MNGWSRGRSGPSSTQPRARAGRRTAGRRGFQSRRVRLLSQRPKRFSGPAGRKSAPVGSPPVPTAVSGRMPRQWERPRPPARPACPGRRRSLQRPGGWPGEEGRSPSRTSCRRPARPGRRRHAGSIMASPARLAEVALITRSKAGDFAESAAGDVAVTAPRRAGPVLGPAGTAVGDGQAGDAGVEERFDDPSAAPPAPEEYVPVGQGSPDSGRCRDRRRRRCCRRRCPLAEARYSLPAPDGPRTGGRPAMASSLKGTVTFAPPAGSGEGDGGGKAVEGARTAFVGQIGCRVWAAKAA